MVHKKIFQIVSLLVVACTASVVFAQSYYNPVATSVTSQQTQAQAIVLFTKSLYKGVSGAEVGLLQECLKKDTALYPEGLVTDYFGLLTEKAVQRFQEKFNIAFPGQDGYGFVGPKTRVRLNDYCFTSASSSGISPLIALPQSLIAKPPSSASLPEPSGPFGEPSLSGYTEEDVASDFAEFFSTQDIDTIPVSPPGPGNCATVKQCQDYCANSKNQAACFSYALKSIGSF